VSAPLPADAVATDLTVNVGTAVGSDTLEALSVGTTGNDIFGCTIPAGNTSCTAAGPSGTITAGTPLIFIDWDPTQTVTSFSYRLVTPGVTPPAIRKAMPKAPGFKR